MRRFIRRVIYDTDHSTLDLTGGLGEVRINGGGKINWDSESHPPTDMLSSISISG
jgi:hypothetical protein